MATEDTIIIKKLANTIASIVSRGGGVKQPDNETTFVDDLGTIHAPRYSLFDIVQKDHELTFEESKGLAKLGSYVYKTSDEANKYGYPDFYNKCLEEYNASEEKELYSSSNVILNGEVINNKGVLSNFLMYDGYETIAAYAQINRNFNNKNYKTFEEVYKIHTPEYIRDWEAIIGEALQTQKYSVSIRIYANKQIYLYLSSTGYDWDIAYEITTDGHEIELDKDYLIRLKFDGKNYTLDVSKKLDTPSWVNFIRVANSNKIVNRTPILGGDYVYGFGGQIDLNGCYLKQNDQIVWQGVNKVTVKQNKNGHVYYNLSDKEKIIKQNQYGIDLVNEKILLPSFVDLERYLVDKKEPTNDDPSWYNLYSDGWCEQGGSRKIIGELNFVFNLPIKYKDTDYEVVATASDESYTEETGVEPAVGFKTQSSFRVGISEGYGGVQLVMWNANGYTDKPVAENNFYMVVGNTTVKKAQSEYTQVTTSENDTLPLFTGMYFDFKPNHVSWIKAGGNADGKIYKTAYNELVKCLNSVDNKYNLKVAENAEKDDRTDYSEYWIINQQEETFRTPLKTSLLNTISNARILIEKKEPTKKDTSWYNLYSDGWLEQGGDLLPSYGDWQYTVIEFPIAFKDTYYHVSLTSSWDSQCDASYINNFANKKPNQVTCAFLSYNESGYGIGTWKASGYANAPTLEQIANNENTSLYFKVGNAVQNVELIDCGEVLEELNLAIKKDECKSYIIDTYVNGTSGYRIWSDGWCKQWGHINCKEYSQTSVKISFLKEFKNVYYHLGGDYDPGEGLGQSTFWFSHQIEASTQKTTTGFSRDIIENPFTTGYNWVAEGYLKDGEY